MKKSAIFAGFAVAGFAALALAFAAPFALLSCNLEPDAGEEAAEGVLIYDDEGKVLNGYTPEAPYEMVNATVMQLYANVLLLGGAVEWTSDNEADAVSVDKLTGEIHANTSNFGSGTDQGTNSATYAATVTATSVLDPSVKGTVSFRVRGTRPR